MPVDDLLVLGVLAGVLALSGATKLRARRETLDAFVSLRIPSWIRRRPAAVVLPWVELLLAIALIASPDRVLVVVTVGVTVLMATYTAVIARALTFAEPVTCSCFGRLGGHRVDRLTLVRNLLLTGLGLWALLIAIGGGSFLMAAGDLDAGGWAAVAAALTIGATSALIAAGARGPIGAYGEGEFDYLRSPIPFARVRFLDGGSETLRGLASTQARLLLILSPNCAPCRRLGDQVEAWAARLEPNVSVLTIYPDSLDPAEAYAHHRDRIASDLEGNVGAVFAITGTPAAVLLGADGLLAGGPVVGPEAIVEMFDDLVRDLDPTP